MSNPTVWYWPEWVALAKEMIGDAAREVQFLSISKTPVDPAKPWQPQGTVENVVSGNAVFVPIGSGLGTNFATEDMLKRIDLVAIVEPKIDVVASHKVKDDTGKIYKVEWVQELRPGETKILSYVGLKE